MNPVAIADAVQARLETSTYFLTYRSDLVLKRPAKGYVVFMPSAGVAYTDRYSGSSRALRWQCRVLCVGYTDGHAVNVAMAARDLLQDWRPDPDRAASPLRDDGDDPPLLRAEVEGDVRWSITLRYLLTTPR